MAASQLQGLFSTVVYEYSPNPSQLQGLFSTVVYEYSPNPSQLQGLFSTVVYEYSPNPSQLQGLFSTVVYEFVTNASVDDITGTPGVIATFDGSASVAEFFTWEWTSLPGGSALFNYPKALPDSGVGSLMADNEGLYHFEGNADDSSGNSRNLTLHNAPTYVTGKVGSNAINFDGANQYGEVVIPISTSGTIATWLNFSSTPTQGDVIAAFGTLASGTNGSWRAISYHGGGLSFYGRGNASNDIYNWASVTTDRWYHVAITWDAANLVSCYLDGVLITAQTKSLVAPDTTFTVAARLNAGTFYAPVKLDETAVWSRVLSASEVTEVYEEGSKTGLDISTATASFTPDVAGTYTVRLTVSDGVSTTANAVISAAGGDNKRAKRRKRRTKGARGRGFSEKHIVRATSGNVVINGFEEI